MKLEVTAKGRVDVGPPTLARTIPRSARITVNDTDPYDIDIRLSWDDAEQRLVAEDVRIQRRPSGPAVRTSDMAALKIGSLIEGALAAEVLDDRGWPGVIADNPNIDPAAVDALIYAMSHALGGHRPTQTVALARGLQPGSGIKRVMRARELGYLGEATQGRSGGLARDQAETTLAS